MSGEDRDYDSDRHDKGRRALKDGEWACTDAKCARVNAEHRNTCELCGKPKPRAKNRVGKEIGKEQAEKSKGLFSAEDWVCSKCGNVNWARRKTCNVCNAPKLADLERRTGYGGGYMDRQDVEYVKRDFDEVFDEFGRIKKKDGGRIDDNGDEGEIDDEDEEEVDLNKYKLDDDDEEEGDEEDLAKYDLTSDADISEKKVEAIKPKVLDEVESDCSCSCSGGECSCEDSECELKASSRDREKVHKTAGERDRERERHTRKRSRSKSKTREKRRSKSRERDRRSRSRDRKERKRSRSRERKRSRSRERRKSRSRSYDRDRKKDRVRDRDRHRGNRSRSRSRDRRR